MAMADQLDEFNSRLTRIADPRNTSYYDPEMAMNIPKRVSKEYINRKKLKKAGSSALLVSLLVGALALMVSQLVNSRLGILDQDATFLIFGAAGLVALLMGGILRLKTMPHVGAQFAGVALMVATMHNLVWMFPDQFAAIYSPEFVSMVQATTTAGSVTFMGATISL